MIEGWKWRIADGTPDTHKWINVKSYHTWRLITNLSVFLAPLEFYLWYSIGGLDTAIATMVIGFVCGWQVYERIIGYVQYNDAFRVRPKFHLMGYDLKRPSPVYELVFTTIMVLLTVIFI